MTRVQAGIVVAASLCALLAVGCGGGTASPTTTQRTLPGGRLGGTPLIAFTAPRNVTVHVGETARVPLTITNHSSRVHVLQLRSGASEGLDVELAPARITLPPRRTEAVTLTLLAHAPGTRRIDLVASLLGDPLQAWRTTVAVDARAS